MDIADAAENEVQSYIESTIRKNSNGNKQLLPIGMCHYCDEPVDHPKLYCNGECATDHANELKRMKHK